MIRAHDDIILLLQYEMGIVTSIYSNPHFSFCLDFVVVVVILYEYEYVYEYEYFEHTIATPYLITEPSIEISTINVLQKKIKRN